MKEITTAPEPRVDNSGVVPAAIRYFRNPLHKPNCQGSKRYLLKRKSGGETLERVFTGFYLNTTCWEWTFWYTAEVA